MGKLNIGQIFLLITACEFFFSSLLNKINNVSEKNECKRAKITQGDYIHVHGMFSLTKCLPGGSTPDVGEGGCSRRTASGLTPKAELCHR